MDEKFLDSMVMTITTYQTAFKSFLKENNYDMELARALTDSWWRGLMVMSGLACQKQDGYKTGGMDF